MGPYKYAVFATKLRAALDDSGWTQAELARELQLEQQAVSKWVTGQTRPRPQTLTRLASLFGWDGTEALQAAGYVGDGTEEKLPVRTRSTVQDRLAALEVRVEAQDEKLDEILALLRAGGEPR